MSKTYLQEKITGTEGQVVMINSSGNAEAQTKDFGLKPRIRVTVESGARVTVTNGTQSYQQLSTGVVLSFDVDDYGTWTASATKNGKTSNSVATLVDTVQIYDVTLTFFASTITVTVTSGSTVTCAKSGTTTQTKTSTGTAVFTVTEAGTYTITATLNGDSASGTVSITASGQSKALTLAYVKIYGVIWDGSSTTAFSRTDDAADFTNPLPYISGKGRYSSPFDNRMPWSGMVRTSDATAGELVAIPKYWFKWTKSGQSMKLQIADKATTGFSVSPAHADRGDGKGERDIVYVGRYHCNSSYKSITGSSPNTSIARGRARSGIHNLGSTYWQYDFAMYWTIMMLYLVEFADWNSQAKIGYGCGNGGAAENVGASDNMPYHTGTMQSSRTTYGVGCQYRYIEGLWDNVHDWCDGVYFSGSNMYCIKNPASFSDTANGTLVGTRPTSKGYISAWNIPDASDFGYALYPSAVAGSESTYTCDYCDYASNGVTLHCGGYSHENPNENWKWYGLFYLDGGLGSSNSATDIGCRLQKLP